MPTDFNGFPREAFTFFKNLEKNNNREWFQAHKDAYERDCRGPMQALAAALEPALGAARISRINRDLRFSPNRAPYKTHIAAGIGGYYVSLSADGVFVGTGIYRPDRPVLQRLRAAIDDNGSGRELEKIVASLRRKGFEVDTHDTVASAPRGFSADHPRIELLRMKDIFAGRSFKPVPWLSTPAALPEIRQVMRELRPFRDWVRQNVSG